MRRKFTDAQILAAVEEMGTQRAAAAFLGLHPRNVERRLARIRSQSGTDDTQDGYYVKGRSTLYDAQTGEAKLEWVKTAVDDERRQVLIEEAIAAMCDAVPRAKPRKARGDYADQLMSVYPMGDPHFGMYSWAEETGADFDLATCRRDLVAAVQYLVDQSPPSRRGVLISLGDLFHADNMAGVTSRSGHVLDMDTRLPKVFGVGVATLRAGVDAMLAKHETVEVVFAPGNHDEVLAFAVAILFANVYENEPRVRIYDQPTQRHYIEHGKTLVGVVHGHLTKDRDLPGIMATERPEAWGRTRHRYFYRGHHHHDVRTEYNGCIVEQMRTLAAGDAYAVGSGYLSGRDMKCIVHHAEYGEVARSICSIDMLRDAAA